jgi:hypothetical protein
MASSSVRSGREDDVDIDAVPAPLRTRLGPEATVGLLELLDLSHRAERDAVISACTERFERRLVEEVSGLRVQIAQVESSIRQDMAQLGAGLRQEMGEMRLGLRQEMGEMRAGLRQEMGEMRAGLREEMASGRIELFKWCFLFWIGQVLAIGGLMGVMLRLTR